MDYEEPRILTEWEADANQSVHFHYVWDAVDTFDSELQLELESASDREHVHEQAVASFNPDMSHQIFGPEEVIVGYKEPRVDIYFAVGKMVPYATFTYAEKRKEDAKAIRLALKKLIEQKRQNRRKVVEDSDDEDDAGDDATRDDDFDDPAKIDVYELLDSQGVPLRNVDVLDRLTRHAIGFEAVEIQSTVLRNVAPDRSAFVKECERSLNWTPPGTMAASFSSGERVFEIWESSFGDPACRAFHDNVQTFVLWYVDAASVLPLDDHKWQLFYLFEKRTMGSTGNYKYGLAAFCTAYPFYVYPDRSRLSVSQFLTLPPYRCKGLGDRLLRHIFVAARNAEYALIPSAKPFPVVDVSVETPVTDFIRLRDKCALRMIVESELLPRNADGEFPDFSPQLVTKIQTALMLSKPCIRRCYEVLKLLRVSVSHDIEVIRQYEKDVKNRLFVEYRPLLIQLEPIELKSQLDDLYKDTIKYYRKLENF
eukprot:ANDGO_02531.mRNA.1 Histone acetyltransferase type B catalytic subunit DDB_G0275159